MFKSISALKNALKQIKNISDDDIQQTVLSETNHITELMFVNKNNQEVLGYATITYQGIRPGYGKVFDTTARFA